MSAPVEIASIAAVIGLSFLLFTAIRIAFRRTAPAPRDHGPSERTTLANGINGRLDLLDELLVQVDQDLARTDDLLTLEERKRPADSRARVLRHEFLETLATEATSEEEELHSTGREVFHLRTLLREEGTQGDRRAA